MPCIALSTSVPRFWWWELLEVEGVEWKVGFGKKKLKTCKYSTAM